MPGEEEVDDVTDDEDEHETERPLWFECFFACGFFVKRLDCCVQQRGCRLDGIGCFGRFGKIGCWLFRMFMVCFYWGLYDALPGMLERMLCRCGPLVM